jgi:hypothetical protein
VKEAATEKQYAGADAAAADLELFATAREKAIAVRTIQTQV